MDALDDDVVCVEPVKTRCPSCGASALEVEQKQGGGGHCCAAAQSKAARKQRASTRRSARTSAPQQAASSAAVPALPSAEARPTARLCSGCGRAEAAASTTASASASAAAVTGTVMAECEAGHTWCTPCIGAQSGGADAVCRAVGCGRALTAFSRFALCHVAGQHAGALLQLWAAECGGRQLVDDLDAPPRCATCLRSARSASATSVTAALLSLDALQALVGDALVLRTHEGSHAAALYVCEDKKCGASTCRLCRGAARDSAGARGALPGPRAPPQRLPAGPAGRRQRPLDFVDVAWLGGGGCVGAPAQEAEARRRTRGDGRRRCGRRRTRRDCCGEGRRIRRQREGAREGPEGARGRGAHGRGDDGRAGAAPSAADGAPASAAALVHQRPRAVCAAPGAADPRAAAAAAQRQPAGHERAPRAVLPAAAPRARAQPRRPRPVRSACAQRRRGQRLHCAQPRGVYRHQRPLLPPPGPRAARGRGAASAQPLHEHSGHGRPRPLHARLCGAQHCGGSDVRAVERRSHVLIAVVVLPVLVAAPAGAGRGGEG